ncbi:hypothetical protein SFRURICE_011345 [Spodoptera frugiperda]|nr:hypothetical protein SFRURICE_011345 [Spodoptera frugiperda]
MKQVQRGDAIISQLHDFRNISLVDFFHSWPTVLLVASVSARHTSKAARHATRHSSRHSSRHSARHASKATRHTTRHSARHATRHSTRHSSRHAARHSSGHATRHSSRHSSRHSARHASKATRHATRHTARPLRARAVHLGHDGRADALHVLQLVLVLLLLRQRVVVEPLERVVARVPRRALVLFRELVSGLVQRLLHAEHVRLELVPRRYALPLLLVLILVLLGLGEHALDLGLRQASLVVLDHDVLASAGAVLFGRHVEDAVRVQVEGDVDLRDAARRGRDAGQVERAQQVVVLGHRSLALVHLDRDRRLVVRVRGERLRLLARDLTVALDDLRHHAAGGFDAEGQRGHVHQQHVLDLRVLLAAQDGRLDGRAVRDRLVRVDGEVQLLAAEEVLQQTLHLRDPGGASDEDDVVDLALVHLGVLERLLDRLEGASEQVCVELFEARAGHASVEVDSLVERVDLDGGFGAGRQRALSALGGCAEAAQCARIHAHVLLVLALELVREMVHQSVVEVLASEMRVARRRPHFEQRAFVDGQDRHVERSAAEVEDEDVPLALEVLVEAVRERSAVGSLMILSTFSPAMAPASLVAWR